VYVAYYWEKELNSDTLVSGFNCGEWELQTDPMMGINTLGPLIINLQQANGYSSVVPMAVIPLPLKGDAGILVPKVNLLS
jgi:hypothetical protein